MQLNILYEDNHLLAIAKPAGLPTMGVAADRPSLVREGKQYIKEKYDKPGNVYLGIMSRLDAPVTGVVLMARTSKAASRLTDMFRHGEVEKEYWAIVEGHPDPAADQCIDWIRRDARHRKVHLTKAHHAEGKEARLRYQTLKRFRSTTWLEIALETGRKHQIRIQLGSRGWPVVGDRKYGARTRLPDGIALHARRLALIHPVRKEPLEIVAEVPSHWPS